MSFGLGVWVNSKSLSNDEAAAVYQQLGEAPDVVVDNKEAIDAFLADLTKRYPTAYELEPGSDECVWANDLERSDGHVLVSIAWSKVAKVAPFVMRTALKHDLTCYDPQSGLVWLPKHLQPEKPKKKR